MSFLNSPIRISLHSTSPSRRFRYLVASRLLIRIEELSLIDINGIAIPFVTQAHILGSFMRSDISWRDQIFSISKRVHFTLHKLKFHRNSLFLELRIKLVSTLIFPLLDDCCLLYHDVTNELKANLQGLINCAIRFIFGLRRDEHILVPASTGTILGGYRCPIDVGTSLELKCTKSFIVLPLSISRKSSLGQMSR